MKKLLLFFAILCYHGISAQGINFQYLVQDQFGNPMPGINVVVQYGPPASPAIATYTSDNAGYVGDSIPNNTGGFIQALAQANGCIDSTVHYYQFGMNLNVNDTLNLCVNGNLCNYTVNHSPTSPATNPGMYTFSSNYPFSAYSNILWTFGDGDTSIFPNPHHKYTQVGTYTYCLQVDSCPPVCGTVTVTTSTPCSYYVSNSWRFTDSLLTYRFNTNHLGTANSTYLWTFGDGDSSTVYSPLHSYANPGTYIYCLDVDSCPVICDTIEVYPQKQINVQGKIIDQAGNPMVNYPYYFSLDLNYQSLGFGSVIFFDPVFLPDLKTDANGFYSKSIYAPIAPLLSDIDVRAQANDTCNGGGIVGLTHSLGVNTTTQSVFDTLLTSCSSNPCSFQITAGSSVLNPNFVNFWLSDSTITLSTWDFGDGTIQTMNSYFTNHTYSSPGTYYVCVTAGGCPTICDSITVANPCSFNFEMSPHYFDSLLTFSYSHMKPNAQNTLWDFGDGNTSTQSSGFHTYSSPGTYTYCVQVDGCPVACKTIVVSTKTKLEMTGYAFDSISNPIQFKPMVINLNNPVTGVYQSFYGPWPDTDANGYYSGTVYIDLPAAQRELYASITYLCNGVSPQKGQIYLVNSNTPNSTYHDSIYACQSTPIGCQASFIIDTVNSHSGNIVVWNMSTPLPNPTTQVQYLWDFGDGNTSTQPYPTHTYAGAGTYPLCLSIQTTVGGAICSDLYCDTLKVDSLGNIIQKSTGATITLNVLDPNTISIDEWQSIQEIKLFPNPTNSNLNIEFTSNRRARVKFEIVDLKGSIYSIGEGESQVGENTFQVDLSSLSKGVYTLIIQDSENIYYEKIIKN
ncbi:MAG: PKD domain-containing protein [Schleiferiaceae bacterium]|nr:PKD domain-containing protein [Schleiferiaceae bacterium]